MTYDNKPLNVGGLLPYEAFICDPPDYFIANEKFMEMTELLKKVLKGRHTMGTRNLTIVYMNGAYRVAQYGQWDGYPEGQGIACLRFLRDQMDENTFREAVSRIKYIDAEKLEKMWMDYGMESDGSIPISAADRFRKTFPEFSRDTGAEILTMIQNNCTTSNCLEDNLIFAADSLFCEWAYVIDFDRRTFEVYKGFNKTPLEEKDRFYILRRYEDDNGYHGVKLAKEFNLDALPTDDEFLSCFEEEDDKRTGQFNPGL